jgi:hypothetical protein
MNLTCLVDSVGEITLGGLLYRKGPFGSAACWISKWIAIAFVNGLLQDSSIPTIEEI